MNWRRPSLFLIVGSAMLASGCAALSPKPEGAVGAIRWHVTDLRRGNPTGAYRFTLVLADVEGVGMQITNIGWRAYQPGVITASGFIACSQMAQVQWPPFPKCPDWKGRRLAVNEELRIPLSISGICFQTCPPFNPLWEVTVAGTDDQGHPVRA
jgi:hypothetical protein